MKTTSNYRSPFAEAKDVNGPTRAHIYWTNHMKRYVATGDRGHYHQMLSHVTNDNPPENNDPGWIEMAKIGPDIRGGLKTVAVNNFLILCALMILATAVFVVMLAS